MKIDNGFALAMSIAIAVSLTTTMDRVRAEADSIIKPQATDSMQMKKVNVNRALTRTKLKTMSADSVLKLSQEGKVNLTKADLSELNALTGKGKKININANEYSTVMCPW
jgi:hypothetical protein